MQKGQPAPYLKMWLGAMYQAQVLKRGSYDESRALLVRRLGADADLRREAEDLRTTLRQVVKARPNAHVEAKTLEYLEDVLSKENQNG